MTDEPHSASRRDVLKSALAASLAVPAAAAGAAEPVTARSRRAHLSGLENDRPGDRDWQLTRVKLDKAGRSTAVEAFCSKQSYAVGDTITIYVNLEPQADFKIEFFRMGYYGGAGARLAGVVHCSAWSFPKQPVPEAGPRRLRECDWSDAYEVEHKIPLDWTSGVYLGRITTATEQDGSGYWQSYVVFVVRDNRECDVLFQVSDNTWQAYNKWPGDDSLYTDPRGAHAPGVAVSFDRPYAKYPQVVDAPHTVGSGEFLLWEYPLCYWLEKHGYDVSYVSNVDLLDPQQPLRAKAFISVGHDEYWDVRQYETLRAARDAGVNLLFLSANTAYMVSPFEPSSDGRPNRIISRAASFGPMTEEETQSYGHMMGPFPYAGPDEAQLIGARSTVPFNGAGDWICTRPEHWIFAGTGMKKGDKIPGLVGWEWHGEPASIAGLEIVGEGTVLAGGTRPGHWTSTIYPGPKGNFVFNASTIWWAQGLSSPPGHILPFSHGSRPHGPDERVERITHNLLRRAITGKA